MSELEAQNAETSAMVKHRKTELARNMQAGIEVPASELAQLSRLEVGMANRHAAVRLADLTREDVIDDDAVVEELEELEELEA